ncbi:hypothetical protein LUZ60_005109 [Juncus effusus]|nr:hypothetical protein LUZ60_005109 [Juncus effusus]
MADIHIISKSKVQLPTSDFPPPGSTIELSFFDARISQFSFMQTVFLYPNATASPFSFNSFKSSLSLALLHFHPFVGDLTYLASSDDVAIVCSKDSGVIAIEAESDFDIQRLSNDITLDVEAFQQLVPIITSNDQLPMPVLSVQFTSFSGGGIAVGIASHHAVMDGRGLWQFIDCWAKTCHDGAVPSGLSPVHDRAVIAIPHKEEMKKRILKFFAPNLPNLPKVNKPSSDPNPDHIQSTRFLTVHLSSVQLLKQRIVGEATVPISTPPTTFEALAAQFWIAVARAKGLTSEDITPTLLTMPMDCRALLDPPIITTYTGNCVRSIFVESNGTSLMASDGLSNTRAKIAEAISIAKKKPIGGTNMNDPAQDIMRSFKGLKVHIAGSPRFVAYEADFGWGKPHLHVRVPNLKFDGVYMNVGREEGTVQLTVVLQGGMDEFVRAFEEGFQP